MNPSISYTHLSFRGSGRAAADPSWHWARGGLHPGQVTSQSITSLRCQSPFSTPFSSFELCWIETGLFSEVSFDNDWNLSALWYITSQPESWASITISLICLLAHSLFLVFVLLSLPTFFTTVLFSLRFFLSILYSRSKRGILHSE